MKNFKTYLFSLSLLLTIGMTSCNDEDIPSCSLAFQSLQSHVDEGKLLIEITDDGENYLLNFENESVKITKNLIDNITTNSDTWKSTITFVDGTSYIIPSLGTSLESLITNIEVNPSGYNPLAAKVLMNLPALGRIKVTVHSKENSLVPNVNYFFSNIEKSQSITILGLYPSYNNQVTLTYTDKQGNERKSSTIQIKTNSLKDIFLPKNLNIVKADINKMEPGMTLVSSPGESDEDTSVPYMFDADGNIRWILDWHNHPELKHIGMHCGLHRMKNGNYVAGDINNRQIVEVNLLGELINSWKTNNFGFTFHHEVFETSDKKILIAATKVDAKTADNSNVRILDHIAELDPHSGSISKIWDLAQVLDSSRIVFSIIPDGYEANTFAQSKSNWCHNNGVKETADGSILCTSRWQGLVKFTRSGSLKWIVSPHNAWKKQFEKYLLTPLDRNGNPITDPDVLNGKKDHPDFSWGWGIHCPVEMPNGHVMFFDNGYSRLFNFKDAKRYSRAVEYEIDEQAMTIRQVWEYGRERGKNCFSTQVSGVQYLEQTDNRLFCPGINNQLSNGYGGHIIEINPKTGEIVFEAEVQSTGSPAFHRANRISLYPEGL